MNRNTFIYGRSKRPKRYHGARVKPVPGLKPFYYWHDGLRGKVTGDVGCENGAFTSLVYVEWDGYGGVRSTCEWSWLQRE